MRPILIMILLLAALAGSAARAATTDPVVARDIAEAMQECRSAGGNPTLRPGFETQQDFNRDGQPDTILNFEHFACPGPPALFCGTGGCLLRVYASGPAGSRRVFDDLAYAWSFQAEGSRPVLVLRVNNTWCNGPGSGPCVLRLPWNGSGFPELGSIPAPPRR